jgi:hypothetical protein
MWTNNITEWLLKSPLQRLFSGNTMIIYYTGRRSGKAYHLPIGYLHMNDSLLTVSFKRRTWWRNLRGGAAVTLFLQGKMVPAQAKVMEDDPGVAEGLRAYIGQNPQAARMLGIKMNANGQPEPESLQQAVIDRVIVRTNLK